MSPFNASLPSALHFLRDNSIRNVVGRRQAQVCLMNVRHNKPGLTARNQVQLPLTDTSSTPGSASRRSR